MISCQTCEEDPVSATQGTSSTMATFIYSATTEDPLHLICTWNKRETEENLHSTEHSYSLHTCMHPEMDTYENEEPGTGEDCRSISGAL